MIPPTDQPLIGSALSATGHGVQCAEANPNAGVRSARRDASRRRVSSPGITRRLTGSGSRDPDTRRGGHEHVATNGTHSHFVPNAPYASMTSSGATSCWAWVRRGL